MNSGKKSFTKNPISHGDGRCKDCLHKLVFMTQCEALGCGRWVCEHRLIIKKSIKNLENLNFCSHECSCSDVDFYLAQRRYNLQKSKKI